MLPNTGPVDPKEKWAWEVAVLAGIDEVLASLQRIATGPEYEGKPAATLAAGWVSGLVLTEKERLRRSVEEHRSE